MNPATMCCTLSFPPSSLLLRARHRAKTRTHGVSLRTIMSTTHPHPSRPSPSPDPDSLGAVLKYHNQTKHSLTRYAKGPHGLDWANQPNPFRRYLSGPLVPLLHIPPTRDDPPYPAIFRGLPQPAPLSKLSISQLFYDSLALSAWKTTGFSTWSLRANPSSGNLHPTESYLISGPVAGLADGPFVAHYAPKEHALEVRADVPAFLWDRLRPGLPEGSFFIGLTSIFWREAWKYGERAFRYCNHDVGHAIAAVAMAAASLGWDTRLVDGLGHRELEALLGTRPPPSEEKGPLRADFARGKFRELEREHPDCLILVFPSGSGEFAINFDELSAAAAEFSGLEWKGTANSLSKEHVYWDIIYKTAEVVEKPSGINGEQLHIQEFSGSPVFSESAYLKGVSAREIARKRRSAVDMDGVHVMNREVFYQVLLHCLPSPQGSGRGQQTLPFRVLPWDSQLHMALFVHRIAGLPQGLYFLVRNSDHFDRLKQGMRTEFEWAKPEGCPADLPLYRLAKGNCCELAKRVSCHQDIAGDGCFSLGMVAHFQPTLRDKHIWMYPRLFWESGILGQVLYLEAHAVGISATGIGCYFDDAVHEILGLRGSEFQSLYHFTVGAPVLDKRIMNLPAYPGPAIDA
ncbi:uncharacterized protein LOC116265751 [Nymphaea colorata]|nr:uncharacterized protein LOC116265751 [Nymphaea colorata]